MAIFSIGINQILQQAKDLWLSIFEMFRLIIQAPRHFPEMIWILIPLTLTLLLIELYFGRYIEEELGWNTAFGNTLVLIFVAIDLAKHLYLTNGSMFIFDFKLAIVLAVLLEGLLLTFLDYFHSLPKKVAFQISSKFPTNYVAYIAIILVYTNPEYIPLDSITFFAFIFALIVFLSVITIIHFIVQKVRSQLKMSAPEPPKK